MMRSVSDSETRRAVQSGAPAPQSEGIRQRGRPYAPHAHAMACLEHSPGTGPARRMRRGER
eukprot:7389604-Prymnesium_polylepis.4